MEWDLTPGFRRGGALYRFGENGRREKVNCGVRNVEFGTENKKVSIPQSALCNPQSRMAFGKSYGKGGSRAQLAFNLDISPVEFNNLLNEGEPDP